MSGFYTADFPDNPPSFFNFTDDYSSDLTFPTIQATKVRMLNYNEEVEVDFQGTNMIYASIEHPMHLHGYSFYAIGSGYGV
nr:laccase-14 [Quercus suber]